MRKKTCVPRVRVRADTRNHDAAGVYEEHMSYWTAPETSCDDDVEMVLDSSDGRDVDIKQRQCPESGRTSSSSNGGCFLCGIVDDQLLFCRGTDCPIVLHKKCWDDEPDFDDNGGYLCPYCSYKKAIKTFRALREKAIEAKKSLSQFIDPEMIVEAKDFDNAIQVEGQQPDRLHDETRYNNHDKDGMNHKESRVEAEYLDGVHESRRGIAAEDHPGVMQIGESVVSKGGERIEVENYGCDEEKGIGDEHGNLDKDEGVNQFEASEDGERSPAEVAEAEDETYNGATDIQAQRISEAKNPEHHLKMFEDSKAMMTNHKAEYQRREQCHASGKDKQSYADVLSSPSTEEASSAKVVEGDKENVKNKERRQTNATETLTSSTESTNQHSISSRGDQTFEMRWRQSKKEALPQDDGCPKNSSPTTSVRKRMNRKKEVISPKPSLAKRKSSSASNEQLRNQRKSVISPRVSPAKRKPLIVSNERRKRLYWAPEEEDALREGVEKFSTMSKKNFPWRKVLEFGQHVFHESRTPSDLKDKWRNMMRCR